MFIRAYHCGRPMTYISMFRIHYKIYIHFSYIPFRTNIVYSVKVRTYVSNEKKMYKNTRFQDGLIKSIYPSLWACYRYPENVLPQMDNLFFRDVLRHFSTKKYQSHTNSNNSSILRTKLVDLIDMYYI